MATASSNGCERCAVLEKELEALRAELALLRDEIARLRKDSSNSSKPPSSDIVKPTSKGADKRKRKRRKRGGQPGHPRRQRSAFSASEIDRTWEYSLDSCPKCHTSLQPSKLPPRIVQQVELIERPIQISEHRSSAHWCPQCQAVHYAPIDAVVRRAGLVGPRLSALIGYLKGACHCSFSTIQKFLRDVVGVPLSTGQIAKVRDKVGRSLQGAYEQLADLARTQPYLNTDETGHKNNGKRMWTWCFRAALFTLFKIAPTRSHEVLLEVLGREFDGVLGCDYFSAYRKYMRKCSVQVQFCLAHLIRDLKFLTEHPHPKNRAYGRRVLAACRKLFAVIHRRDQLPPKTFAGLLEDAGNELWAAAIYRVPRTTEADNLASRFEKHGESYIRFVTTPGIEPTNNLAEQAIRFVVIDRRITQGTRSQAGQTWCERIWTVLATCAQQGRSTFHFLHETLNANLEGKPTPSLVPNTS